MMKLTDNFSRHEFTKSRTALKKGIDNSIPFALMENVITLAKWLQVLRDRLCEHYGREIYIKINSGYRCPELNKIIGGSKNSAHVNALAADIEATSISPYELVCFIKDYMSDCPVDQVILEFDSWVHIGLDEPEYMRNLFLEAHCIKQFGKSKVKYRKFFKRECKGAFCEH